MLLVRLEIIPTTHHSTIFKIHVFSLYYHLCIYRATYLHMVYLDWLQAVIESNSRYAWKWWASELRDILCGRDRVSSGTHLEAVIERSWRYTWRPWLSELRDALWDRDWATLEIHLEAVIKRVWRYTWRTRSSEFGGRNCVSLEMRLETMIVRTWRP